MADLRAREAETDSTAERAPSTGERVPAPRLAIAEVPDWVIQRIDRVDYPTRMARRRALEAARTVNGWEPDAAITAPLLDQVAVELVQMPDAPSATPGQQRALTKSERRCARRQQAGAAAVQQRPQPSSGALGVVRPGRHAADVVPAAVPRSPGLRPVRPSRPAAGRRLGPLRRPEVRPPAAPGVPDPFDTLPPQVRPRRVPRRLTAGLVLAAVVIGGACVTALDRDGGRGSDGASVTDVVPPQQVLAVALARQGQLTGVSLLASGSDEPQQVLVPSRLLLDVPGAGRIAVAQSLGPGDSAPGAALGDALEIRVAGTWVLSSVALAQLVEAVGGVQVDVDVDVLQGNAAGSPILVAAGPAQRLTGALAARYAQLLADEEPEASRLTRQDRVLTALLARLPLDRVRRRALFAALPGAPVGSTLDVVVVVTGDLRTAAAGHSLASTVLPVRDIDTGGVVSAYGLNSAATAALVHARLPGAALPVATGGRLRVLVQNGVGTPGLGEVARTRLVAAGLQYVGGGNVEGFGVAETVVLLPDGTSGSRQRGAAVTRALGLPESALRISDTTTTVVDVVVVLGKDFPAS